MQTRRAAIGAAAGAVALCLSVAPAWAQVVIKRDKGASEAMQAPPAAEPRRDYPVTEEPSHEGQLVDEDPRCQQYAHRAADQYRLTTSRPGCEVAADDRWHADVRRHYRWCLRARDERRDAEQNARDEHLYGCGAQRH
jgi:hypothetical protein